MRDKTKEQLEDEIIPSGRLGKWIGVIATILAGFSLVKMVNNKIGGHKGQPNHLVFYK